MERTLRVLGLFIITIFLTFGLAQQQQGGQGQEGQQNPQEATQAIDTFFTLAAMQGDTYEINSAQLATERTSNAQIQDFAQQLIQDHTDTSQRLTEIATQMNEADVDPTLRPNPVFQIMIAGLTNLQGEAFDREFVRQQVIAHQAAIDFYRIAAESAQHEDLRAFANETLPVLRQHLQTARSLMQELGMTEDDLNGGQGL